ncbi:MAG: hypothetical protein RLY93_09055 [Sumerlaeia bacterium]
MSAAQPFLNLRKTFIISAGRTGTQFFGDLASELVPGCFSIHEPDKVDWHTLSRDERWRRLRQQGVVRPYLLKALGTSGARNHSLNYLEGRISEKEAIERFIKDRKWIVGDRKLYVESNAQLFGLGNLLAELPNSHVLFFVRHPKTWVSSWLSKVWYSEKDILTRIDRGGLRRLTPDNAGIACPEWPDYSRAEKLAWTWLTMNRLFAELNAEGRKNVALFRYEDVFLERKDQELHRLLVALSHGLVSGDEAGRLRQMLDQKINVRPRQSENEEEGLENWLRADLLSGVKDLMETLGYSE